MDTTVSTMLIFNEDFLDVIFTLHNPKGMCGGNFQANQTVSLTKALHHLLLPKEGYYFHPDSLTIIVSMAILSDNQHTEMDTNVNNAIYVVNDNIMYI